MFGWVQFKLPQDIKMAVVENNVAEFDQYDYLCRKIEKQDELYGYTIVSSDIISRRTTSVVSLFDTATI